MSKFNKGAIAGTASILGRGQGDLHAAPYGRRRENGWAGIPFDDAGLTFDGAGRASGQGDPNDEGEGKGDRYGGTLKGNSYG